MNIFHPKSRYSKKQKQNSKIQSYPPLLSCLSCSVFPLLLQDYMSMSLFFVKLQMILLCVRKCLEDMFTKKIL